MQVIAVANQKGGTGKSTTAFSLAAGLKMKNFNVLCVDLDPQGNLSHTLGVDSVEVDAMDVLSGNVSIQDAVIQAAQGHIVAGTPSLTGADAVIRGPGKEYRLKSALSALTGYDYVVMDTPPALGILLVNALTSCTGCIITAQADLYSLQGILNLNSTIRTVKKHCNQALTILGILLVRYNRRTAVSRDIAEQMEEVATTLGTKVFTTKIREAVAVKESQIMRKNIFEYAKRSKVATDYADFIDEVLKG